MPDCQVCYGTGIHNVPWSNKVERCDACERHDSDFDAIQELLRDRRRMDWLESKSSTIGITRVTVDEAMRQQEQRHA